MRGRFNFGAPDRIRTYEPFVLRAVRFLVTNQILIAGAALLARSY